MNRGELRKNLISRLQEESDPRQWTRKELNDYLNEAAVEFNKKTWQVRLEMVYTVGLYDNLFPVPADVIEIIRARFWDGTDRNPLTSKTRAWLDREKGSGWEDDTASEPDYYFEALPEDPPYINVRDYISLYPIPTAGAITIAQEGLSAELNGVGELVWQNGDTTRGIPVGMSDQNVYLLGGDDFGQIVGIYERSDTEDALMIEAAKIPRPMTHDGDGPEVRPTNHSALVNYALHKCFDRPGETRDANMANYFFQLFEAGRKADKGQPIVRQRRRVKPWR